MSDHTIIVIWVLKISFLYSSSVYSCHLLISSASVRSIPFLSFIKPVKIPKIAVETQTGNEKGAGSWRADRQETGGLSAPREEANFRQLWCQPASSARACCQISAGPGVSARLLSVAWVWPSNMPLVSQLWGRSGLGGLFSAAGLERPPDSQSE